MKCAFLQIDLTAGDIAGNERGIVSAMEQSTAQGALLCVTPELALIGCEAGDYLRYPSFMAECERAIQRLAKAADNLNVALALGCPRQEGGKYHNSVAFLAPGKCIFWYDKRKLSTGENVYFVPGTEETIFEWNNATIALSIDCDFEEYALRHGPGQIDMLVNLQAEPFYLEDKEKTWRKMGAAAKKLEAHSLLANAVGSSGAQIFPGWSTWFGRTGIPYVRAKGFAADIFLFDTDYPEKYAAYFHTSPEEDTIASLAMGIRDYCSKSRRDKVVLELSGSPDSALATCLACKAVGPENVIGILMPSSPDSGEKTAAILKLTENLGIKTHIVPIQPLLNVMDGLLATPLGNQEPDFTAEATAEHQRATVLAAFAKALEAVPLNSSNKSALALGLSSSCGELNALGDFYENDVRKLCQWLNAQDGGPIPIEILAVAPGWPDNANLEKYDAALKGLLDEKLDAASLQSRGLEQRMVQQVADLLGLSRRPLNQSPLILEAHRPSRLNMPANAKLPFMLENEISMRPETVDQRVAHEPYLSVVAVSRNDDHGGNPLKRTQMFIDSLAWQSSRYQLPAELVLVDWNPPSERPGLAEALSFPANPYFTARVIVVPEDLHNGYRHSGELSLFQMIGKNVGIRRAKGQFVLATNIDILLDDMLFEAVAERDLEPQRLYRADRYDVANTAPAGDHGALRSFCRQTGNHVRRNHREKPAAFGKLQELDPVTSASLLKSPEKLRQFDFIEGQIPLCELRPGSDINFLSTNACGDFTMLHRDAWFDLRGYAELEAFSMNIDSLALICAHYAGYRETSFLPPHVCYHIEHAAGSGWTPEHAGALYERVTRAGIPYIDWEIAEAHMIPRLREENGWIMNDDYWGLAKAELEEIEFRDGGIVIRKPGKPYMSDGHRLSALLDCYEPAVMLQDWSKNQEDGWQRQYGESFETYSELIKTMSPEYIAWGLKLAKRAQESKINLADH